VPPASPTLLTAVKGTGKTVDLAWVNNSWDVIFYIDRSTDGIVYNTIYATDQWDTTYTDATVDYDTLYYYRVRAYGDIIYMSYCGYSAAFSNVALVRVTPPPLCEVIYTLELDYGAGWVDVTDKLNYARSRRGFSSPLARVATQGNAGFTLENTARTFSPALAPTLLPRLPVQFTMTYDGVSEVLFTGSIRTIAPTPDIRSTRKLSMLDCVDDMELLDIFEGQIAILINTFADDVIDGVVASAYTPAATDYETGLNAFPVAADRWSYEGITVNSGRRGPTESARASQKILDATVSDWGHFFIAKDGTPTFFNRHHETLDVTTELTLDNTMHRLSYRKSLQQIINHVEITCYPRSIGTVPEVLGRLSQTNAPSIEAGATLTLTLQFRDPVDQTIELGGLDLLDINAYQGLDIVATVDPAGSGTDVTADIVVVMTDYGNRVELALTNGGLAMAYIQTLQVRGYAVRSREPVTIISQNAASVLAYGRRKLAINAPLMSNIADAQALADHLVQYYKDPLDEITAVTFSAHTNVTLMEAARDIELLDRVSLTEDQTGVSSTFFIYSIQHDIRDNYRHEVTLGLLKAFELGAGVDPWIWDLSLWDSGDVWIY